MLVGRLGLESARIPHVDRHGLVHLDRGQLYVDDGCLRFKAGGSPTLPRGDYALPHQTVSMVLLGPGSTVSHDALRILARHGTGLVAVGADGVRCYTAVPLGPDTSALARRQVSLWSDTRTGRPLIVRRMYAHRFGTIMPRRDVATLRGIEGSRVKALYANLAQQHGILWQGRRYDRAAPHASDAPNQAINHASSAVEAAAAIAVAATGTIPQLGFIHEDSGQSWVLDVADLFRDSITVPCAFRAVRMSMDRQGQPLEQLVRQHTGTTLRKQGVIPAMIDLIKRLLEEPAGGAKAGTDTDGDPTAAPPALPLSPGDATNADDSRSDA